MSESEYDLVVIGSAQRARRAPSGTRPAQGAEIPFDNHRIVDTDHLADLGGLPREIIVVGAGVVGLEYASFIAALGAHVTLIDQRASILEFVDRQIIEALSYHLRQQGVTFRLAETVTHVGIDSVRDRVVAELESGKKVQGDALVYAVGRQRRSASIGSSWISR